MKHLRLAALPVLLLASACATSANAGAGATAQRGDPNLIRRTELSEAQLAYAASDVLHLHALRDKLDGMLMREGRASLAEACFRFLPHRARLDLLGWAEDDIFAHS